MPKKAKKKTSKENLDNKKEKVVIKKLKSSEPIEIGGSKKNDVLTEKVEVVADRFQDFEEFLKPLKGRSQGEVEVSLESDPEVTEFVIQKEEPSKSDVVYKTDNKHYTSLPTQHQGQKTEDDTRQYSANVSGSSAEEISHMGRGMANQSDFRQKISDSALGQQTFNDREGDVIREYDPSGDRKSIAESEREKYEVR